MCSLSKGTQWVLGSQGRFGLWALPVAVWPSGIHHPPVLVQMCLPGALSAHSASQAHFSYLCNWLSWFAVSCSSSPCQRSFMAGWQGSQVPAPRCTAQHITGQAPSPAAELKLAVLPAPFQGINSPPLALCVGLYALLSRISPVLLSPLGEDQPALDGTGLCGNFHRDPGLLCVRRVLCLLLQ